MFPTIAYLRWARRFHGKVRFNLAASGVPACGLSLDASAAHPADGAGVEALREAIARYNGVAREEVVACLGTSHALWLAYVSVVSPGDEVLVEQPAYEPLVAAAVGAGASVRRFARSPATRFALDVDRVAREITSRTRAVAVTSLQNPGGNRASDEELRALARVAERHGAVLVVDEVYAPFDRLVDDSGVFGRSARRLAPNLIAIGSLTKCYGLAAERVGWLIAPECS
jgi:aspartate/methionine/tyrosine aminotransferase